MIALIDADVVVYRTAWASQNEVEAIACIRAQKTVEEILRVVQATEYELWLSDSLETTYRYQIDSGYKKSRVDQPKPKWYWSIKTFLQNQMGAVITLGQEADDQLGIRQCELTRGDGAINIGKSIICSIDKDLLQIPGRHFNWVRKEVMEQSPLEGLRSFYSQALIGDRVDDIDGVTGIGRVKAAKLLNGLSTEIEMFDKVRYQYSDDERLLRNGRLLWIRHEQNEIWNFPTTNNTSDESDLQDESGEYSDSTH